MVAGVCTGRLAGLPMFCIRNFCAFSQYCRLLLLTGRYRIMKEKNDQKICILFVFFSLQSIHRLKFTIKFINLFASLNKTVPTFLLTTLLKLIITISAAPNYVGNLPRIACVIF